MLSVSFIKINEERSEEKLNEESVCLRLYGQKKQSEDVTSGSGKLR